MTTPRGDIYTRDMTAAPAPAKLRPYQRVRTVRVLVEPDAENRALEITVESENCFSKSRHQLDDDRTARTRVFEYRDLPAGDYDCRAVLIDQSGDSAAVATATVSIRH